MRCSRPLISVKIIHQRWWWRTIVIFCVNLALRLRAKKMTMKEKIRQKFHREMKRSEHTPLLADSEIVCQVWMIDIDSRRRKILHFVRFRCFFFVVESWTLYTSSIQRTSAQQSKPKQNRHQRETKNENIFLFFRILHWIRLSEQAHFSSLATHLSTHTVELQKKLVEKKNCLYFLFVSNRETGLQQQ